MRLRPRDRRAITIGATLALPLAFTLFVIRPFHTVRDQLRAELEREAALLGRELALAGDRHSLEAALLDRVHATAAAGSSAFDGGDALASSRMADYVVRAAGSSGVAVQSAESRGVGEGPDGIRVAAMDLAAVGEWDAVYRFLSRMSTSPKQLWVVAFEVSPSPAVPGRLFLQARVEGLATPPPSRHDREPS